MLMMTFFRRWLFPLFTFLIFSNLFFLIFQFNG